MAFCLLLTTNESDILSPDYICHMKISPRVKSMIYEIVTEVMFSLILRAQLQIQRLLQQGGLQTCRSEKLYLYFYQITQYSYTISIHCCFYCSVQKTNNFPQGRTPWPPLRIPRKPFGAYLGIYNLLRSKTFINLCFVLLHKVRADRSYL